MEKDFITNGLVVLDNCRSCFIIEELNGQYELELEYTIDPRGKWQYLQEENIIKAEGQLFRIYKKIPSTTGIKIYARHVFYDLKDNIVDQLDLRGLSCASALANIFVNIPRFKVMSDITETNDIKVDDESGDIVNLNVIESVFKLIEIYGGELYRDNYNIKLLKTIGQEKGILISYGKNLTGFEEEVDITSVITRIKPIGADGLTLQEKYVDSKNINAFYQPKVGVVEFSDCNDYESLRSAAKKYFQDTKCDFPLSNYKVNFIELSKTEEYKHYKILERVELSDIVLVKNKKLNLDLKCKVIKIKRNVLTGRIDELELGDFKKSFMNAFSSISSTLAKVSNEIVRNKSDLIKAIENASNIIKSQLGGYVIKKENELLIMDTQDIMTAKKVWRWNLGGLAYSSTGYNGEYRLAITMDGSIVADFMTTGTLNTALVTIKNDNNKVYFDSTGLYVNDAQNKTKVRLGNYAPNKYGLQIKSKNDTDIIIDQDGIIQSDTIQLADNVDSTHNLKLKFYIDDGVLLVKKVNLAFSLERFRAYETGAESNQQWTGTVSSYVDSGSALGTVRTSSESVGTPSFSISSAGNHGHDINIQSSGSYHSHSLSGSTDSNYNSHSHSASSGYGGSIYISDAYISHSHNITGSIGSSGDSHSHSASLSSNGDHTHSVNMSYFNSNHSHNLSLNHTHRIDHMHEISIPPHSHDIRYGIFESTLANNVKIIVDGQLKLDNGGSGFTTDHANVDLTQWIQTAGWHTVELSSSQLGRLNASLYVKSFVGI